MAGAKLEIEIVDSGGSAVGGSAPPRAGVPTTPSPSGAAANKNAKSADGADSANITSFADGAKALAKSLGAGPLVNVTEQLTRAVKEMSAAARGDLGGKVRTPATSATPAAPRSSGDAPGRSRPAIPNRTPLNSIKPPEHGPINLPAAPSSSGAATAARAAAAMDSGATAAVGGLARVAAMAGPAAIAASAVVGLGYAAKSVTDTLTEQARELAKYSGVVAVAASKSDVRQQQAEMQRAQSLGPLLAKFENDRGRLSTQFYNLGTRILELVLKLYEKISPMVDATIMGVQLIGELPGLIHADIQILIDYFTGEHKGTDELIKVMFRIERILQGKDDAAPADDYTQQFINQFVGHGLAGRNQQQIGAAAAAAFRRGNGGFAP